MRAREREEKRFSNRSRVLFQITLITLSRGARPHISSMAGRPTHHAHLFYAAADWCYIKRFPATSPLGRAVFLANSRGSLAELLRESGDLAEREVEGHSGVMESALHQRDHIGVQDSVLLEDFQSEDAFLENLQKRFRANLIYVSYPCPFGQCIILRLLKNIFIAR